MKKLKLFLLAIFYIFLYFILTIGLYLTFSNHIYNESNLILASVSSIFVDLFILFVFIIIFRNKLIPDYYDFKKNYKKYIRDNYKYWVLGLILMVISNIVLGLIIGSLPTNEELNRQILLKNPIASIISMVIVAPIIEELITRKTFKDLFKNEYIYIILSGLVFGSLHLLSSTSLIEVLYLFPYAILGSAFAKIYYNTDNLWSNIFFHSLHNLLAILLIFIGA